MQGRTVTVFVVGVLCCAPCMGAAFGVFSALSNDAQAQSGETWKVQTFSKRSEVKGGGV